MKRILVCGVGGIGSFLTAELSRLILKNQIDLDNVEMTLADDDTVEEKNILYQNFTKDAIFKKKAEVLADKYGFDCIPKRINTNKQLDGYDLIISAVDNSATRKLIYEYCFDTNPKADFIDLRSEGRAVAFFTKNGNKEEVVASLGKNISGEGMSCQLKHDTDAGIIQNGNVIIASIAAQLLLNWLRGEKNPLKFVYRF